MDVGFCVTVQNLRAECRLHGPPAALSAQVSSRADGGLACVLLGRLYYRAELCRDLGLPGDAADGDAGLALRAFSRWGAKGLRRLEGDFSLLIWDGLRGMLIGLRDPLGGFPLFWAEHEGTFAFSTSLRPLLRLLPGRSPDPEYLADFLALPGCFCNEVPSQRCAYPGVRRVLPGQAVVLDVRAARVSQDSAWDWGEQIEDPGSDRLEDFAAGVADRLRQAVRQRLRGPSAAHLSGGMDSTSVCLLARDCSRETLQSQPIHAISLDYETWPVLAREGRFLDLALRGQQGLVSHRLPGEALLQFDGFRDPPAHEEPCPALESLAPERAMVEEAAGAGAATLLTGFGADELLDVPPYHIADFLRRGKLLSAWAEAGRWAREGNQGLWEVLWPFGLAELAPAWLHGGIGALWRGGFAPWRRQAAGNLPPWIRPEFARRWDLRDRVLRHVRRKAGSRPAGLAAALDAVASRVGDSTRWLLGSPRGVHTAHPFLDVRLLRFELGVRARLRPEPGMQKPILAEAMRGTLPEEIRTRPGKGNFNETYFHGLARNLADLEGLVLEAPEEYLDWLDREALLSCLYQASLGVAGDAVGMDRLSLALALLLWLTRQEQWQRRPLQEGGVCWRGAVNDPVGALLPSFLRPAAQASDWNCQSRMS